MIEILTDEACDINPSGARRTYCTAVDICGASCCSVAQDAMAFCSQWHMAYAAQNCKRGQNNDARHRSNESDIESP